MHARVVILGLVVLSAACSGTVYAQAADASSPAAVAQLEDQIRNAEADLKSQHDAVVKKIEFVVKLAAQVRDTRNSGSNAVILKEDCVRELRKMVTYYKAQKDQIHARLEAEPNPVMREEWEKQLRQADAMIEGRIDDIIRVAASLTAYSGLANFNGNGETGEIRDSTERKAAQDVSRVRVKVEDNLEAMEAARKPLQDELRQATEESRRAELKQALADLDQRIAKRRSQFAELTAGGGAGGQRPVSAQAAHDLDREVTDSFRDVRVEYDKLFQQKNDLDELRRQLAKAKVDAAGK